MNGEEAYLGEVSSRLTGMDGRVRDDIIRELRSNIKDLVRSRGGDVQAAIASLESPAEVARRYKQLYGYGTAFKVLFVLIAALLAVPTLPVLQIGGEEILIPVLVSVLLLAVLVVYLFYVAVQAGKGVGLMAGLAACVVRLGLFGLLALAGGSNVIAEGGGIGLFIVVSALLILIGYIPGEAKARWAGPKGEI